MKDLHWLPVESRIVFKVLVLVYKCQNGLGPGYLTDMVIMYTPVWSLRSSTHRMLMVPRTRLKTVGDVIPPSGVISLANGPAFIPSVCFQALRQPAGHQPRPLAVQALPSTSQCSAAPPSLSGSWRPWQEDWQLARRSPLCRTVGSSRVTARASPQGLGPSARAGAQDQPGRTAPTASSDASAHLTARESSLAGHA